MVAQSLTSPLQSTSFGVRAGSAGWGVEYKLKVRTPLDFRFVWQTLAPGRFEVDTSDDEDTTSQLLYDAKGRFTTVGVIADWYPWESPIRFSTGIFRNGTRFLVTERDEFNSVRNNYNAQFGKLAYFFGAGWAARSSPNRLTLTLDAGLLAQQPAQVFWQPDDRIRNNQSQARIWSERQRLKQEFDDYKILPFIMFGLSYQFF